MLLFQHDLCPSDKSGECKTPELLAQYELLLTTFAAGFLSEITSIGHSCTFTRPNAFQSGNGDVLEIHACDAEGGALQWGQSHLSVVCSVE